MKIWITFLGTLVIFGGILMVIAGRVDPKLDFAEVAARVVEQKESKENNGQNTNVKGVRVTVDTKTDLKGSPESKSSESSDSSSSDGTSRSVGVRTDVTFEISNETNETRSQEANVGNKKKNKKDKNNKGENDEDYDDIPIIKGRTTPPKKPREQDVTTWRPNVRPLNPNRNDIPWTKQFPSSGVWTTERNQFGYYDNNNNNNYNPSQPVGTHIPPHSYQRNFDHQVQFYPYPIIGQPSWQSCRCDLLRPDISYNGDASYGGWTPSSSSNSATSVGRKNKNYHHYTLIDDKLDEPFSITSKKSDSRRRRESNEKPLLR